MTNYNIEEIRKEIEELHSTGLATDEILSTLNLPFDIDNTISPTNQDLMRLRAEQGATEEDLKSTAALIALLRSWKQDEKLKSELSPSDYESYNLLKSEYNAITSKDNITEADRKRLVEISEMMATLVRE